MPRTSSTPAETVALRRRAKRTIDRLSGLPLHLAADFLSYIQERQPDEATKELLATPGFAESLARGEKDLRSGRVKAWRKVRSDV